MLVKKNLADLKLVLSLKWRNHSIMDATMVNVI